MTQIRLAVGDYSGDIQKRLDYTSDSNVYEIFPDSFISEFTKASNFTDFCEMIGCDITSQTDLDKLQDDAYYWWEWCSYQYFCFRTYSLCLLTGFVCCISGTLGLKKISTGSFRFKNAVIFIASSNVN